MFKNINPSIFKYEIAERINGLNHKDHNGRSNLELLCFANNSLTEFSDNNQNFYVYGMFIKLKLKRSEHTDGSQSFRRYLTMEGKDFDVVYRVDDGYIEISDLGNQKEYFGYSWA